MPSETANLNGLTQIGAPVSTRGSRKIPAAVTTASAAITPVSTSSGRCQRSTSGRAIAKVVITAACGFTAIVSPTRGPLRWPLVGAGLLPREEDRHVQPLADGEGRRGELGVGGDQS